MTRPSGMSLQQWGLACQMAAEMMLDDDIPARAALADAVRMARRG